jgi:hypothetical protein
VRASYADRMPFKDTPGLRRVAAMAIEHRDLVEVRVLPVPFVCIVEGTELRAGQTLTLTRRCAVDLAERGIVELLG